MGALAAGCVFTDHVHRCSRAFALMTGSDHCRPLGADLRRPRRLLALALAFAPASLTCQHPHHLTSLRSSYPPHMRRVAVQRGRAVCGAAAGV